MARTHQCMTLTDLTDLPPAARVAQYAASTFPGQPPCQSPRRPKSGVRMRSKRNRLQRVDRICAIIYGDDPVSAVKIESWKPRC